MLGFFEVMRKKKTTDEETKFGARLLLNGYEQEAFIITTTSCRWEGLAAAAAYTRQPLLLAGTKISTASSNW